MPKRAVLHRTASSAHGGPLPAPPDLALQISAARALIAAGILAAPVTFVRALGADSATAARVTWLTRMMAVRDGAIGLGGASAARSGSGAAPWLAAGAVSDAVDAVVLLGAVRDGRLGGPVPRATVLVAAGLAAVGGLTAGRLRHH